MREAEAGAGSWERESAEVGRGHSRLSAREPIGPLDGVLWALNHFTSIYLTLISKTMCTTVSERVLTCLGDHWKLTRKLLIPYAAELDM